MIPQLGNEINQLLARAEQLRNNIREQNQQQQQALELRALRVQMAEHNHNNLRRLQQLREQRLTSTFSQITSGG